MQKLAFPGTRNLDQFKCLSGSLSRTSKADLMNPRLSSESHSSGSFANLKITAEKLVKEQASVKSDLEMANLKLKKSADYLHTLEEKLQHAYNENAKLKVKLKEDEKLWLGLDSKFSSTKTLYDQLTETLQHLAGVVQDAEKDKKLFEDRLAASSVALESLHQQVTGLSSELESAEKTAIDRENVLKDLRIEKEEREAFLNDEKRIMADLIKEKDSKIMQCEAAVDSNTLAAESLNAELSDMRYQLRSKEDNFQDLRICHNNLQKEKSDLQAHYDDCIVKSAKAHQEIEQLKYFIHALSAHLIELDKQSLSFSDKFVKLKIVYDSLIKSLQLERDLITKRAQQQYNKLQVQLAQKASEKDELHSLNLELKNRVSELQRTQEFAMVQHAEECRVAEERIQHLESDVEALLSKKAEMENCISDMEKNNKSLSESSKLCENKLQELLERFSTMESENRCNVENFQSVIQKKNEETATLQKEIAKSEQHMGSLETHIRQLENILEEKEKLIAQHNDQEKRLENQKEEIQAFLAAAESKIADEKKQYDVMLENKQLELSRHLKEISHRNDQAIDEIRKKYEVEKLEIVNLEKEKAEKLVKAVEGKCEKKLRECGEELNQNIVRIQEEHASLIARIQQEHERRELTLKANHSSELRRIQLEVENELREKTAQLVNEHEVKIKGLIHQHKDECENLEEELHIQKSREDKQRALLQLQWKAMDDKAQEEQEVNSKKNYSISSAKMRKSVDGSIDEHALPRQEEVDSPYVRASQTPVSNLLNKAGEVNVGGAIPKHRRKETHREYEVETSNGNTVTKRRKTKSTVLYADPRKNKGIKTPMAKTSGNVVRAVKGSDPSRPSNIGDLFSEGSLNPYADDPYAFG